MKATSPRRNVSLDLLRCFAFFCVVCVHFFKNTPFYNTPAEGGEMYLMTMMRTFFMICVPLFLMLSGYLLGNKTVCAAYYLRILRILCIYFMAAVSCTVYSSISNPGSFSITAFLSSTVGFWQPSYAWYVEMYIGLFLLIPFLNILYHSLPDQKTKRILLGSLLMLTAVPGVSNIWRPFDPNWWLQPSSSSAYYFLMPDHWTSLYPFTYYFLGMYLREYPLGISKQKSVLFILACFLIFGTFSFYRSYGSVFVDGAWQGHESLLTVIQTVLVFHLFTTFKLTRMPEKLCRLFSLFSDSCLGAYLVSWLFDKWFYPILTSRCITVQECFSFFVPIILAVCICSMSLSLFFTFIYTKLINPFLNKLTSSLNVRSNGS